MPTLTRSDVIEQIHANIDKISKDHLAGLLHALINRNELGPEALAFIARTSQPPRRRESGEAGTATLAELAGGMLYQEREGKRQWLRILEIGPVRNFDTNGAQQYRDARVEPAFGHAFQDSRPIRIFGYERPFLIEIPTV